MQQSPSAHLMRGLHNSLRCQNQQQTEMIKTTAMLEKLGVDAKTATTSFQFFNLNLGMTATQAQDAQKQLALMGRKLGKNAEEMTKEFNSSLSILAVYGDRSVDVFSNLAAASKAAGVETGKLLNVVKKFDTFAGASEGVGKLNALLGTQLSTTQMLMMSEDERLETLIGTVQSQGVAFKDMDKFTQMAIASAAGIDDMNEAQKIFGMNLGDYQENKDMMDKNAAAQAKFEEAVDATIPAMMKFKNLATELVVGVTPALEILASAAEWLTENLRKLTVDQRETITGTLALVTGGFMLYKTIGMIAKGYKAYQATMALVKGSMVAIKGLQAADITQKGLQTAATITKTGADVAEEVVMASQTVTIGGQVVAKGALATANTGVATTGTAAATALRAMANPYVLGGFAILTVAIVLVADAMGYYHEQTARIAEAEARQAEARVKQIKAMKGLGEGFKALSTINLGDTAVGLSMIVLKLQELGSNEETMAKTKELFQSMAGLKNIGGSFKALSEINLDTAAAGAGAMVEKLKELGGGEEIMIKTRATLENLALVSVGKAKDSMTGNTITAAKGDITANIQNVFKNMNVVVEIGGEQFDAKVKQIATEAAAEVVGGTP